jgi:hypothetical protein
VPEARLTGVDFHRGPSGASGVDFDHGSGSSVDFDHGSAAPQVEPWLSVVPPASSLSLVPPLPGNGTLLDLPPNGAPPPLSPDLDPDGRTATVPPAEAAEPPQPAEEPAGEGKAPKPPRVRRHRRLRLTPGLVVVVLFLIACLVVVGEVVAKSGNDKPPSPSQVSSVAP